MRAKGREPAPQQGEVVSSGCQHSVDTVSVSAIEIIAVRAVFGFDAVDDGLTAEGRFHLQRVAAVVRSLCGRPRLGIFSRGCVRDNRCLRSGKASCRHGWLVMMTLASKKACSISY